MSIGEQLRAARTRQGIDLDTLARTSRIGRKYLEAIEADQPAKCPGAFFYRSFVRQYASTVGLDPTQLEQEIDRLQPVVVSIPGETAHEPFPLRSPDPIVTASNRVYFAGGGRVWGSVLALVAVVVGCSAFYAWWRIREDRGVQPPPSRPAVVAQRQPAPVSVLPQNTTATAEPPQETPQATATVGPVNAQTISAPLSAAPGAHIVVSVTSKEPAWISLNADGSHSFSGTLDQGQMRSVDGNEHVRLRVGNAGGIEVSLNGKDIGPVGPRGQVRIIEFSRDGYQVLPPSGSAALAPSEAPVDTGRRRQPTL